MANFSLDTSLLDSNVKNLSVLFVEILFSKVSWRCSYRTHLSHASVRLRLVAALPG